MENKSLGDYSKEDLLQILNDNVDAIVMVDTTIGKYRSIVRRNVFVNLIDEVGEYHDFIEKIWFHMGDSSVEVSDDYKAFISYYEKFKGKYSRRVKLYEKGSDKPHLIQMNVYPVRGTDKYVFAMDELAEDEYIEEFMTDKKVNAIQNTYLFSMFVDLIEDTTSSISVTEISEDTVNSNISYSQWRNVTVNMIWPESQPQFQEMTDPAYLKKHLEPGQTLSMDCMMKNLEGTFIWVKLLFSRAHTINPDDFKFVFIVQDINNDVVERLETLRKYEELIMIDSLTGLYNRGGIKNEIMNSITSFQKKGNPVSLMMIDLDNFKKVNDTYGHSVGDATLKSFADLIKKSLPDKHACAGRWGGEEFIIDITDLPFDKAYSFADELREKVAVTDFGEAGHITCSIGISQLKEQDSIDTIFNRIDKAMYKSKKTGRNRVTVL